MWFPDHDAPLVIVRTLWNLSNEEYGVILVPPSMFFALIYINITVVDDLTLLGYTLLLI